MPKPKVKSNPEDIQKEDPQSTRSNVHEEIEQPELHSSADEGEYNSDDSLEDASHDSNSRRRHKPEQSMQKPVGRARILPAHKAPLLLNPEGYQTWRARFLSYCFSIDPIYRRILEGRDTGNRGHEDQLFNALEYAVGDVQEALKIVQVLSDKSTATKGSQAWKFLKQRYDRVSESKVQRLLDAHRRGQGHNESMASYLQR